MHLNGLIDIISFVNLLKDKKVSYTIGHHRFDSIMVTVRIVSNIIEVDFFEDHIEYSWFSGDESVHDDQEKLFAMIATHYE